MFIAYHVRVRWYYFRNSSSNQHSVHWSDYSNSVTFITHQTRSLVQCTQHKQIDTVNNLVNDRSTTYTIFLVNKMISNNLKIYDLVNDGCCDNTISLII